MAIGFWIKSLEFSDGTRVPLAPDSITVLVGANNVGKSRSLRDIQRLCESCLRKLGVPVRVLADFDIMRDPTMLANLVSAQGGDWSDLETRWKVFNAAVGQVAGGRTVGEVGKALETLIAKESSTAPFSRKLADSWRDELKPDGPWDVAKRVGIDAVRGEAAVAGKSLLEALRALGVFVIESGELESLDRTANGKSAKWVNAVLAKDLLRAPELEDARRFVSEVFALPDTATAQPTRRSRLPAAFEPAGLKKEAPPSEPAATSRSTPPQQPLAPPTMPRRFSGWVFPLILAAMVVAAVAGFLSGFVLHGPPGDGARSTPSPSAS